MSIGKEKTDLLKSSIKMRKSQFSGGDVEQSEDLLENIYTMWKEGNSVFIQDLLGMMTITKGECEKCIELLRQRGLVKSSECELDKTNEIILTPSGKELGAEIIKKHQYLKGFLKAVCNVDDDTADYDACRMEHIISEETLNGIRSFMKIGSISDRVVRGHDLSDFYRDGEYVFDMSMYDLDTNSPRVFCKEFDLFGENINVIVGDRSYFYLSPNDGGAFAEEKDVWYMYDGRWYRSDSGYKGYEIPGDVFIYTISGVVSIMSGEVKIAFTDVGCDPTEKDMRLMSVHLW